MNKIEKYCPTKNWKKIKKKCSGTDGFFEKIKRFWKNEEYEKIKKYLKRLKKTLRVGSTTMHLANDSLTLGAPSTFRRPGRMHRLSVSVFLVFPCFFVFLFFWIHSNFSAASSHCPVRFLCTRKPIDPIAFKSKAPQSALSCRYGSKTVASASCVRWAPISTWKK